MDKYIGFDMDSKKTVACVVQNGKKDNQLVRTLKPIRIISRNITAVTGYEKRCPAALADQSGEWTGGDNEMRMNNIVFS